MRGITLPAAAIIVAMTRSGVIGREGGLPWHIPEDLQLFRRLTMGGTLIMGRRTHEAIGRPLPGRINLVLSRTLPPVPEIEICRRFEDALRKADALGRPIYFIGGAEVFARALPLVDELHVSWIREDYPGDVRFPAFRPEEWEEVEREEHAEFEYVRYRRVAESR